MCRRSNGEMQFQNVTNRIKSAYVMNMDFVLLNSGICIENILKILWYLRFFLSHTHTWCNTVNFYSGHAHTKRNCLIKVYCCFDFIISTGFSTCNIHILIYNSSRSFSFFLGGKTSIINNKSFNVFYTNKFFHYLTWFIQNYLYVFYCYYYCECSI